LKELTANNQEIQKLVAFHNAFKALFDIIEAEGYTDGGIVVHDCLQLITNLMRNNISNQNYFRETNCIPRLVPVLLHHIARPTPLADDSDSPAPVRYFSNTPLILLEYSLMSMQDYG